MSGRLSIRDAFDELLDLTREQRTERIREMSLSPDEIGRLNAMLEADARDAFAAPAAADLIQAWHDDTRDLATFVGRRVGSFRLLERVGEGGSSMVFRASRPAGTGEQIVALKILRVNFVSPELARRFEREQAILANLSHPHIAKLIESGVDAEIGPYIAMEFASGKPITQAANQGRYDLRARLRQFAVLCRAVDAAHAALVVHCDLKPSNVLVGENAELKVLDFGIARMLDPAGVADVTRSISLTPEYAAPEQFSNRPPTVAVDVHALGVVLAELLSGRRLRGSDSLLASQAVLADGDSTIPAGLPDRAALARALRGDLDAIVATATSEAVSSRYRSASALCDDIERYLAGRPVSARVPSFGYRVAKFIGRNRYTVAATAVVAALLSASFGLALWNAVRATRASEHAQTQLARAMTMRDLIFDMLSETEPSTPEKKDITLDASLERAIASLSAANGEPRTRLEVIFRFADTLGRRGQAPRALHWLEAALSEAESRLGRDDPLTLDLAQRVAFYETGAGRIDEARRRVDDLLARIPPDLVELRIKALRRSASIAWRDRDRDRVLRDGGLAVSLAGDPGDRVLLRETLADYGAALLGVDEVEAAASTFERVLALSVEQFGPNHERVSMATSGLARAYRRLGDIDRAQAMAWRTLSIDRAILPPDHPTLANHLNALVQVLLLSRDYERAMEAAQESLRILARSVGEDHPDRLTAVYMVGFVLAAMERFAEAETYLKGVLERRSALLGDAAYLTSLTRSTYGYVVGMRGDVARGIAEIERSIRDMEAMQRPDFDLVARALERRIRLALRAGDVAGAMRVQERLVDVARRIQGPDGSWWVGRVETLEAKILLARGDPAGANAKLQRAEQASSGTALPDRSLRVERMLLSAKASAAMGDESSARRKAKEARLLLEKLPFPGSELRSLAAALPSDT